MREFEGGRLVDRLTGVEYTNWKESRNRLERLVDDDENERWRVDEKVQGGCGVKRWR